MWNTSIRWCYTGCGKGGAAETGACSEIDLPTEVKPLCATPAITEKVVMTA